ncbi:MAG TPA: FkbM family methyltransferase [Anaerolineae bacterium]|nr:FkbM family methyltransferase [Anaerolineae bacterium]
MVDINKIPGFQTVKPWLRLYWERFFDLGKRDYFSQFGEDAFLQAYFVRKQWLRMGKPSTRFSRTRQIPPGFFVDVGAYSPKLFSNTYWFYKRGWRGINIDPTPGSMRAFRLIRPRDINLELAIAAEDGELKFQNWGPSSVMNTAATDALDVRSDLQGHGGELITVPARRLDSLFAEYLPPNQHIDFMSVDVEGFELDVLSSNNWEKYRPELIMVEQYGDTLPEIQASDTMALMESVDYQFYAWVRPNAVYRDRRITDE